MQKVVMLQKASYRNKLEKARKWQNILRMGHLSLSEFFFNNYQKQPRSLSLYFQSSVEDGRTDSWTFESEFKAGSKSCVFKSENWIRLEGTTVGLSGPTSLFKQSHPREHGTGLCSDSSGVFPVREPTNSGQFVLVLCHCTVKKLFIMKFKWNFNPFVCCFLSCCLAPQKRAWLLPATLPSDTDRYWWGLFWRLNKPSCLSLSL